MSALRATPPRPTIASAPFSSATGAFQLAVPLAIPASAAARTFLGCNSAGGETRHAARRARGTMEDQARSSLLALTCLCPSLPTCVWSDTGAARCCRGRPIHRTNGSGRRRIADPLGAHFEVSNPRCVHAHTIGRARWWAGTEGLFNPALSRWPRSPPSTPWLGWRGPLQNPVGCRTSVLLPAFQGWREHRGFSVPRSQHD